jgi:hypothetical protein
VDTLADSATETGKWCWAVVANDCFAGSTANTIYWVNEAFDTTFISTTENTCRVAEFGSLNGDMCFGNTGAISASTTQWQLPGPNTQTVNAESARVVSKFGRTYREAATENVKVDPLGKVLFARGGYYVMPPDFPGRGSASATFRQVRVSRNAVPAGTATMLVEFGYNELYHCNRNRDGVCIAESAALNESSPYKFSHETITGLPCTSPSVGSPCVVTVPAIANRVLHYSVVYRNGGGTEIYREPRSLAVVN